MDFTAKLIQIMPPIEGEGKNGPWKRQEYIFETDGQYPKKVCVSVWGDKGISDPSIMQAGNILNVSFEVESREYNGRWYTDIRAWKIQTANGVPSANNPQMEATAPTANAALDTQTPNFPTTDEGDSSDDLPF